MLVLYTKEQHAVYILINYIDSLTSFCRKRLSHKNDSVDTSANVAYGEVKTQLARGGAAQDTIRLVTIGSNRQNSEGTMVHNPVSHDLSDKNDIATSSNVAYGGVKLDPAVQGAVYEVPDSLPDGQPTMPVYATCKEL